MQPVIQTENKKLPDDLRTEVIQGFLYTYTRIDANTAKTLEASSFLYALIELLSEKGLLTIEELDERKKEVAKRLLKSFVESGIGLLYQDTEEISMLLKKRLSLIVGAGFMYAGLYPANCLLLSQGRMFLKEKCDGNFQDRILLPMMKMVTACILIGIPASAQ